MRPTRTRYVWLAAIVWGLLGAVPVDAQDRSDSSVVGQLKWRVERLRTAGALRVGDATIPSRELTLEVYERRGFLPLWNAAGALDELLGAIASARDDGLDPEHYHWSALAAADSARSADGLAQRDLLATDAFVRFSHDLRFGRVEPDGPATGREADWLFGGPDRVARLEYVAGSGRVREAIAEVRPQHFVYEGLTASLADLRRIHLNGGWGSVPPGPPLARDSAGARVSLLRQRLAAGGDLQYETPVSDPRYGRAAGERFDSRLEEAVRSFQRRHGLNEDGVVDDRTLTALNVPVDRRIEQVRVNLERARWVAHELPDTVVVVNAAGARVYLMHGDSIRFASRVIVGTSFTQTPSFAATLLYIDLNPTWTVPPGIVGEILANVRSNPRYLRSQGMRVLDSRGREVDPGSIDFRRYTAATFPYVFRQDPGPTNALGRIKLVLPNAHRVYLHDTPTRGLFAEEERLFSHGCVRVEDPVGLAAEVLADPAVWSREALESAIETGETMTIPLAEPVPVFVLYWTAAADPDGEIYFYRDVYGRDPAVLAGLDAPPVKGTLPAPSR